MRDLENEVAEVKCQVDDLQSEDRSIASDRHKVQGSTLRALAEQKGRPSSDCSRIRDVTLGGELQAHPDDGMEA